MLYRTLGRTDLRVSILGLGSGGASRLGQRYNYLHGIAPARYAEVRDRLLPELKAAKQAGLIKHIGITERYQTDHEHKMAPMAIADGDFDVIMVGFNLLSPSAVTTVLPLAGEHQVGIVVMCAVRSVLVNPLGSRGLCPRMEASGPASTRRRPYGGAT
jgi:aryl-alcohol dehydrogenase-like predicted oxidoreductase